MLDLQIGSDYVIISSSGSRYVGTLIARSNKNVTMATRDESEMILPFTSIVSITLEDEYEIDTFQGVGSSITNAYMSGLDFESVMSAMMISGNAEELDVALEISIDLKDLIEEYYGRNPEDTYLEDWK